VDFFPFLYVCIVIGDSTINMVSVEITLNALTPPYYSACPKPRSRFLTSYVMVVFYVQWFNV